MHSKTDSDLGDKPRSPSWLSRRAGALRRRAESLGFGPRLFLALLIALAVVGAVGYRLISNRLAHYQIESYARNLRADADGFEDVARKHKPQIAIRDISEFLDALGRRPDTIEATLIGPGRIVRATNIESLNGRRDSDPRINAALSSGISYAGHETDPSLDPANFEFVTPVSFPSGRYALDMSYGHAGFDAQLAGVKGVLLLVGLLALVGVIGLFYLIGGRLLLRHHRLALQRATRDGLTDLPNHRAFEDEFAQAVAAAGRNPDPLALALLDLDHFKAVNDRYGHPQGDALLRRVSAILRDGRTADRAYRIGGDEFALLMPHTDAEGARILIGRLSRVLGEADAAASTGVATMRDGQAADELRGRGRRGAL